MTDIDGNFSITVHPEATLEVGFMGFKSAMVALKGRASISVTLEEDSELLDEVIVIGYGSMKR